MTPFIAALDRSAVRLAAGIDWIAIALLVVSAAVAFLSVVLRYGFGQSDQLLEEISRYTVLYACFLLVGPCMLRRQHISVDVISASLSPAVQRLWNVFLRLVFLAVVVVVFWSGLVWVLDQYRYGLTIFGSTMPAWLPAVSVPLGMGVAVVFGLVEVAVTVSAAVTGEADAQRSLPPTSID